MNKFNLFKLLVNKCQWQHYMFVLIDCKLRYVAVAGQLAARFRRSLRAACCLSCRVHQFALPENKRAQMKEADILRCTEWQKKVAP